MNGSYKILQDGLKSKNPNLELSTGMGYSLSIKEKALTITVTEEGIVSNMQNDEAAFESWAIVLKSHLPEMVGVVIIDWEKDILHDKPGYHHYNRFIYRLTRFVQTYPWARSGKELPAMPSILVCNVGTQEAAGKVAHKDSSEGWLECDYVEKHRSEYDTMDHQLPVGIFDRTVSKNTHFTTGHNSAIDIWSIKDNLFSLFELKIPSNKPLGIISELMFYTNIMNDIFSHQIMFEDSAKVLKAIKNDYRGFRKLFEAYSSGLISQINAIMLADSLHPGITENVLATMNDSARLKYHNIHFEWKKVSE